MKRLVIISLLISCNQKVYSPPSQAFGVTPLLALPAREQAVDVELSRHAGIFDPSVDAGAGRLRIGLGENTEASVEGTVLHVNTPAASRASRFIYAGRAGARWNPGARNITLFSGVGGGHSSAAGGFIALDSGIAVGYQNCVLVPSIQWSGFVSQPLSPRAVDVSTQIDMPREYDTPSRTSGYTTRAGLRLSLSPAKCRRGESAPWLSAGADVTVMQDVDHSQAVYMGTGVGISIPL